MGVLTPTEFRVQPHIFDMRLPCPRSQAAEAADPRAVERNSKPSAAYLPPFRWEF